MLAKKKNNKKKVLVYLLVIVVIIFIGYLVYQNFLVKETPVSQETSSANNFVKPAKVETTFGKEVFSSFLFNDLEMNGNLPVKVRERGRTNPFQEFLD